MVNTESPLSLLVNTHDIATSVTKGTSIHNINGKCHIKQPESCSICLIG